jgi:NAD(P)-dependent dehydrogenase (short-subunit alcohol dehydrogenase family)
MTRKSQILLASGAIAAAVAGRRILQHRAFSFRGKSVLITGGSRGLGLVMARIFAEEGARLTLIGRNLDTLQAAEAEFRTTGAEVLTVPADVRDRELVENAVQAAVDVYGGIDVLVNNAGIIQVGPREHMTVEDFDNAMATHVWGPLYTMNAVIPHMRRQGSGRIVNISSIGGKIPVPHLAPYVMSKFALAGLSDTLRAELAPDGIYVTSVYPGLMRTGSHVNASFKGQHRAEFALFSIMAGNPLLSIDASRAARQIVEACRRGRPELVITMPARIAVLMHALLPNISAMLAKAAVRLLPSAFSPPEPAANTGWSSRSAWSPSILTRLADKAIDANNERRVA